MYFFKQIFLILQKYLWDVYKIYPIMHFLKYQNESLGEIDILTTASFSHYSNEKMLNKDILTAIPPDL